MFGDATPAHRAVRTIGVLSIAVGIAVSISGCDTREAPTAAGAVEPNATVVRVVDGDTIVVEIDGREERVRLIGIDTPETKRPDTPVECFGPEATAFTERLLPSETAVRIERDVVGRDDYGRLLGYVYRGSDGVFVNYELVRQGLAYPLTIEPNSAYHELFVAASRSAEQSDVGLWSACAT